MLAEGSSHLLFSACSVQERLPAPCALWETGTPELSRHAQACDGATGAQATPNHTVSQVIKLAVAQACTRPHTRSSGFCLTGALA